MNFEHLSRAHPTVLRDARRRRRAHGLHAVPDLPRPHAPRARASRDGCAVWRARRTSTTRSTGRPSCSTASCTRRGTSTAARRSRGRARATPTRAASGEHLARVRPLRLPALLAAGQRPLLAPQRAGRDGHLDRARRPQPGRSSPSGAGGIEPFLDDNAVILMADHAQIAVTQRIRLADALLADWQVLQPNDPAPDEAELAVSPGGRSAMVYLLGEERRAAQSCDAWVLARQRERRGRRPACLERERRGLRVDRSRRAALRPRSRRSPTAAARLGPRRLARSARGSSRADGELRSRAYPGRAGPPVGRARVRAAPATC